MIVRPVSDADYLVHGKAEVSEHRFQAAALIHAGRKDQDRVAVEEDLQFKTEISESFQHDHFMRAPSRDERLPLDDGLDFVSLEPGDERSGRCWAELRRMTTGWHVQHGAIFEHDGVEELQLTTYRAEFCERSSSKQQNASPGPPKLS
jgi:hypothetical protein